MTVTSIASVLVTAASASFLWTVFTRDAFFSLATFTAFWVFIFAEVDYGDYYAATALVKYQYMLITVLLASVAAVALLKLLGTGVLVDVWLPTVPTTGPKSTDNWNIPSILVSLMFIWATTFFAVLADKNNLWAGDIALTGLFPVFIAVICAVIALTFIAITAYQYRSNCTNASYAYLGIYYFFAGFIAVLVPALVWHLSSWESIAINGVVAGIVAFVLDGIILTIGYQLETRGTASGYEGIATGDSWLVAGLRAFLIALVHGLVFGIGGWGIAASTGTDDDDAKRVLVPYLFWLFVIVFLIASAIYVSILCCVPQLTKKSPTNRQFSRGAPAVGRVSPPVERTARDTPLVDRASSQVRARSNMSGISFV